MTERKTLHGPGPDTKGGGFRGGPKRWTGGGPAPARHIPWPEIFKHHISVVEGHLKMVEMVRKHTVEGTGNHRTIMGCVDRAKEMLQLSKQISRTFVPPVNQREQVPLGSSSASMYPGYSPADHEYGKAAEEYGKAAAEARAMGIEIEHPDAEYKIGQAKGVKRMKLAGIREVLAAKGGPSGSGSGTGSESDAFIKQPVKEPATTNGQASAAKAETTIPEGGNPYFIIDTKPTPVNIPGMLSQSLKRSASPPGVVEPKKQSKKAKHKHDGEMPKGEDSAEVKTEDISERVEARLKEKAEKRRMKEEKKRRRGQEGEPAQAAEEPQPVAEPSTIAESSTIAGEAERPKKKKKKAKDSKEEPLPDDTASKKRSNEDNGEAKDRESEQPATAAEEPQPVVEPSTIAGDVERPKKKKKKAKDSKEEPLPDTASKKRLNGDDNEAEDEEGKKKKKKKKANKDSKEEPLPDTASKKRSNEDDGEGEDGEGKKKKKRKTYPTLSELKRMEKNREKMTAGDA